MKREPILLKGVLDLFEACPCNRVPLSKSMAVVSAMRIVVTDDAAVIALDDGMVDIGKIIPRDAALLIHPDFTTQYFIAALARNSHGFIMNFPHRHDFLYHACLTKRKMPVLHVQIRDTQRIGLNEFAPWLDNIAHELGEDIIRIHRFAHFHLQERAHIAVKRRLP